MSLLVNILLEVPTNSIKTKLKTKTFLFFDDKILYVENPEESREKTQ